MKIIKPTVDLYRDIGVTDGVITSLESTTVGNIYADYDEETTYASGEYCVSGFLYYISLQETTGDDPSSSASYWSPVGYSNKYAMFNGATTSSTTWDGEDFVVEISAYGVNAISFFRINADSVNITMTHPTLGEVYNSDYSLRLNTIGIYDYYDYFFLPYPDSDETTSLSVLDLPPYPTATIKVTITSNSDVSLGLMTYGTIREIGTVDYDTALSINDYSTKETNDYGDTTIVERPYTDQIEYELTVTRDQSSYLKSLLSAYRATPITVIGVDDEEGTHIYGFIDDFEITYTDYSTSDVTLTIEGL